MEAAPLVLNSKHAQYSESSTAEAGVPITESQSAYGWCVKHPRTSAPYILVVLEINGPLEPPTLIRALELLATRHSVLRSRFFVAKDERVRMEISDRSSVDLTVNRVSQGLK